MKISFVAVNSKYIHSALAARYLKRYAEKSEIKAETVLGEYTINMSAEDVVSDLYRQNADVYCFSMYIFNRVYILKVMSSLKKLRPSSVFIIGGPEGSADDEELLKRYGYIDFVSLGEGEKVLTALLSCLCGSSVEKVKENYVKNGGSGVSFLWKNGFVRFPNTTPVCDLDEIPFPYTEEDLQDSNKIVYYETSRGCPFFCTYCCSGRENGVRSFSLERIFSDIDRLMAHGLRQVKLVDRTFNYDKKRSLKILKHIAENHNGITNFHLEITPWLIDGELLDFLAEVPVHMFRFEAGIQTTNPHALHAINRNVDLDSYRNRLQSLIDMGFCVHLDLIAGLPYEDYGSFGRSFDDVISLDPEELQLGFLKVLKGTALAEDTQHGMVWTDEPPYTLLYNRYITFDQMEVLRRIESLVDRYFNGGLARRTIRLAADELLKGSVFSFMEGLVGFFFIKGLFGREWSVQLLYDVLAEYIKSIAGDSSDNIIKMLALEYYCYGKQTSIPSWLTGMVKCDHGMLTAVLKDDERLKELLTPVQLSVYSSREPKKWFRNAETVEFCGSLGNEKYLFLYGEGLSRNQRMVKL